MSHQHWGQEGLYMSQKKRKGMWQQMPDTLLMDSSGLVGSRRAIEWWRAPGDSTKVQQCANNNTLSSLASILAILRRRFLWDHVLTTSSWITTELPGTACSWLSPSGFVLFLLRLWTARAGPCTCTPFPVVNVDVRRKWNIYFSNSFQLRVRFWEVCFHFYILYRHQRAFSLSSHRPRTNCCLQGLREGRDRKLKNILKSRFVGSQASRTYCPTNTVPLSPEHSPSLSNLHSSLVICGIPTWQDRTWAGVSPN